MFRTFNLPSLLNMDTFFDQITSGIWWLSVGIAGLLLSVLGTYTVRFIDISFLKTLDFMKFLNEKANKRATDIKEIEKSKVQDLSNDLHEQVIVSFIILRMEIRILVIGIASILIVILRFSENVNPFFKDVSSIILSICFIAILFEFAKLRKWSRILAEGFKGYKQNSKK